MSKLKVENALASALSELDSETDWKKLIEKLDVPGSVYREIGAVNEPMEIAVDAFKWVTGECLERGIESGIGGAGRGRGRSGTEGCADDLREYSNAVLKLADGIGKGPTVLAANGDPQRPKWPSKDEWKDLKVASSQFSKAKAMGWLLAFEIFLGVRGDMVHDGGDLYHIELPISTILLSAMAAGISHRSVRAEIQMANTLLRTYGSVIMKSTKAGERASDLERGNVGAWLDGLDDQNLRAEVVRVAAERSGSEKKAAALRDELTEARAEGAEAKRELERTRRELDAAKAEAARCGDDPAVVVDLRNAVDALDAELKTAYSQLDAAQRRVIELERAAS